MEKHIDENTILSQEIVRRCSFIPVILMIVLIILTAAFVCSTSAYAAEEQNDDASQLMLMKDAEPDTTIEVSDAEGLIHALDPASNSELSTDPDHPTEIVITNSIAMPKDTPVVSPEGTYVILRGRKADGQGPGAGSSEIVLSPEAAWSATSGNITDESVPALIEVEGCMAVIDLSVDTSAASKGVRCTGVAKNGGLYLENSVITGSKLTSKGGLGIYTLGTAVMGEGASVEGISAYTYSQLTGVGVCIGYYYNRTTKVRAQGYLKMLNGSSVRNNAATRQNGGYQANGVGLYVQGRLDICEGAEITGNTAVYSEDGGIGIYAVGGSSSYPAEINMYGGEISRNGENGTSSSMHGASGGGIGIGNYATFTMSGGKISDNLARAGGGGISLNGDGGCRAVLKGGTVENNRAYEMGAGILLQNQNSELVIEGDAVIKDNVNKLDEKEVAAAGLDNTLYYRSGNGGGIYNVGTVLMKGGTISGNQAVSTEKTNIDIYGQGGGIFNAGIFTMTGGTITGNSSGTTAAGGNKCGSGGGVATLGGSDPGETHLSGGVIKNNSAKGLGADVWTNPDNIEYDTVSNKIYVEYTPDPGLLYLGDPELDHSDLEIGVLTLAAGTTAHIAGTLTGSDIGIDCLVKDPGTVIGEPDEDYTILVSDARALHDTAGKKIFDISKGRIVTGKEHTGAYTDISGAVMTFASGDGGQVQNDCPDQIYTGQRICPEPVVTLDGHELTKDEDYQIVFYNNIDVTDEDAPALIRIYGMGDYEGSLDASFSIIPADISTGVIADIRDRLYTGSEVRPALAVTVGQMPLEADTDYTSAYEDNIETGTAKVRLTGKGNYTGQLEGQFRIVDRSGKLIADDEQGLKDCIAAASSGTTSEEEPAVIYIAAPVGSTSEQWQDIALTEPVSVPENVCIELVGDSFDAVIMADQSFTDPYDGENNEGSEEASLIRVDGSLTLTDIVLDASKKSGARDVTVSDSGKLTLGSGALAKGGNAVKGRAVCNAGNMSVSGGAVSGNNAPTGSAIVCGAVYNKGDLTMTSGEISGNMAIKGGGLYNAAGAAAVLSGGSVRDNSVTGDVSNQPFGGYGGGIFNDKDASLTLDEGFVLTGNYSRQYGGGTANFGQMIVDGAEISGNEAELAGGGVFTAGTALMNSGSIERNSLKSVSFADADAHADDSFRYSASNGGGVYIQAGTFTMKGGSIAGNKAVSRYNSSGDYYCEMGNGGGVYVANAEIKDGSTTQECHFIMEGGTISGNTAKSSYIRGRTMGRGGGVYVLGGEDADSSMVPGHFTMTGGTIAGNSANENGDEIFLGNAYVINRERAAGEVRFAGSAVMELGSGASIDSGQPDSDGLYITEGTMLRICSGLGTENSIRVTAEGAQDTGIASAADGYSLTAADAAAFCNSTGIREAQLQDEYIVLVPVIEISDVWQIKMKTSYEYSGSNIRPAVTVKDAEGNTIDENDYEVRYSRRSSTEPGSYSLSVTGLRSYREYGGEVSEDYTITPIDISKAKVSAIPDQVYTGSAIKYIPVTGSITYKGTTLLRGEDYKLSYKNNKAMGKASLIITGQEHFTGKKTVDFRIIPKKAALKKVSSKKTGTLTVTWRKDAGVTGYQIVTAKDSKFKKGKKTKTVTKYTSKGHTFKKLTKKKTYYAKVRAYKTIGGKKCCGAWSKVKKLKIK